MSEFVPWDSQSLAKWAGARAEGEFLDLAGRRTHFLERGQGQPVVLLHGFNLDSSTWVCNVDPLAQRFHVYVPDLWGQGFSTREPLDYCYELFSEQLRLFLDALGIERASLVGHSMGGGTSIVFALRHRERVDKLVLVDSTGIPHPLPFRSKVFRLPGVAELLLSLRTDAIRRKNLADIWVYNEDLLRDGAYDRFTQSQKIEGSSKALLSILRRDFFNTLGDEIRALGGLDIPALIVWGREDRSLPFQCGEEMHHLLPGSKLAILDEAGHLANFDQPEVFNQLLIDFLEGQA